MDYVTTAGTEGGCFFCDYLASGDDEGCHILWRSRDVFVVLNAFPYNTGHLMVAPTRHVAELGDLADGERGQLFTTTFRATEILDRAMAPQGFNVGMNLGIAAGAGIPGHLHMHVVPRWGGDTNFMTTIGATKVLPEMLADTYAKLKPLFSSATGTA